jgi:hypothetical protein
METTMPNSESNYLQETSMLRSPLAGHMTREQLAKETGKSERFWYRLELARTGPPVIRLGRKPMYRIAAVRDWLEAQEKTSRCRARK